MKHNLRFNYSSIFIIVLLLIAIVLTACGSSAGPKTYTIGVVNLSANMDSTVKGFKEGMAALGYVEGKNVTYVYDGPVSVDKLDTVAQDMVKAKVDLILSLTTPATKAAQRKIAPLRNRLPRMFLDTSRRNFTPNPSPCPPRR